MDRFEKEIWPHAAAVLRTARILTRNDAEADDLAQETMLKAFRHLDQLVEPSGAKKWLMTILRTTRIDRARAERPALSLSDFPVDPPAEPAAFEDAWGDPHRVLQQFSDQQMIDVLKRLPEDIRFTLLLVDVEGLDQADAAAVLGVPLGTIKSRTHRGRSMLRELLTPLAKELRIVR